MKITYADKEQVTAPRTSAEKVITAGDMNEIKTAVNANHDGRTIVQLSGANPVPISLADIGKVITNKNGGATTAVLPEIGTDEETQAPVGTIFTFMNINSEAFTINAGGSNQIEVAGETDTFIQSVVQGSSLALIAISNTKWMPLAIVGSWTS